MFRLNAAHDIADSRWQADLPIETQVRFLLPGFDADFDLDRIAHHHRTVRQSVGRDRRNEEGIHIRVENRPARSKRIRGRTGRRGDDQSIGPIAGDDPPRQGFMLRKGLWPRRRRSLSSVVLEGTECQVAGKACLGRRPVRRGPRRVFPEKLD